LRELCFLRKDEPPGCVALHEGPKDEDECVCFQAE